jgi:ribosomal subunit interface protein
MQIQLNTDHNIEGRELLADHVTAVVEAAMSRFSDRITRVEVHLSDENGAKSGQDDKRCMMEVRLEGRQPTAVTHHAASVHQAIDGAVAKLERAVETISGRARDDRQS